MNKNIIDEISLEMLGNGEQWDQELLSIIRMMGNLDQRDRDGRTMLIHCCAYHFPISFHYLIQQGADVNIQDNKGFSALHVAAQKGDYQFVKELLNHGARTDMQDVIGNNPLFRVKYNNIELIRLLIDHGCDPFHKNKFGRSAYDVLSLHPETRGLFTFKTEH